MGNERTTNRRLVVVPVAVVLLLSMMVGMVESQPEGATVEETRQSYVHFPKDASGILLEEVEDIGSPLGLEIVTTLAPGGSSSSSSQQRVSSSEVYSVLKGVVHRLRNQNQIIHANPHYYITNGLDLGCREVKLDEDTGLESEIEVYPVPSQCLGACTNHGRYCIVDNESFDPRADNHRGSLFVEETLRRMCIVEIYHGSDLRFWEYMEEFDRLDCYSALDLNECASRAVYVVPRIDYAPIEDCMHTAGGVIDDVVNVRLKEEMEKANGNQHYHLTDVPFVRFGGKRFTGADILDIPALFSWMCSVYREEKGVTPIACDFCSSCVQVRTCLWELQCDGSPFVTQDFVQQFHQQEAAAESNINASPQFDNPQQPVRPQVPAPVPPVSLPQPTFAPIPVPTSPAPTDAVAEDTTTAAVPPPAQEEENEGSTPTSIIPPPPPATPEVEVEEAVQEEEEEEETSNEESPASTTSGEPSAGGVAEEQQVVDDRGSSTDYNTNNNGYYSNNGNDDDERQDPAFVALAFLVAISIFGVFGLATYLKKKHDQRRINSAEEYFNDLMNESYRDNMAVSGRIEDEMSDRSAEDPGLDEMGGVAPPFSSFKVHMVMN